MRPKSKFRYVNHDLWVIMNPARKQVPMSALGHSRPSHLAPAVNNVRYASDSDHSRYESELTLWANSALMHCGKTATRYPGDGRWRDEPLGGLVIDYNRSDTTGAIVLN